jgi:hypothetical protein
MELPFQSYEGAQSFECVVRRVRRADDDPECEIAVLVDVELPPQYRGVATPRYFNEDGTYRVEALVKFNRRSLAAFIASGDHEWDLGNDEL